AVEAGVAQGLAVLGDVHAEAAGAAGAGREEEVLLDDLFARQALLVAQHLEVLHQVADREIRRVALGAVTELLADPERRVVGAGHVLALVAEPAQRALDEEVLRRGEPADEQRDALALLPRHLRLEHAVDPLPAGLLHAEALALRLLERLEL